MEANDQPKITRLPRSGPRDGQTTAQWLRRQEASDRQWSARSPRASAERRLINPKLRDR
jgi:hypothetical protein